MVVEQGRVVEPHRVVGPRGARPHRARTEVTLPASSSHTSQPLPQLDLLLGLHDLTSSPLANLESLGLLGRKHAPKFACPRPLLTHASSSTNVFGSPYVEHKLLVSSTTSTSRSSRQVENGRLDPALYVQEEGPSVSWGNNVRTDYTVTDNRILIIFIDVFSYLSMTR